MMPFFRRPIAVFRKDALFRKISTIFVLATVGIAGMASPASASASLPFTGQARLAGLSTAEAIELQQQVEARLGHYGGGVQVAANKIRYSGGFELALPLPGERGVRDLQAMSGETVNGCPYTLLCVYQYSYFEGERITAYYCGVWVPMPWGQHDGSIINNQTQDTYMAFVTIDNWVVTCCRAFRMELYGWDWYQITKIEAC